MQEKQDSSVEFIYWFAYYNHQSPSVRYRAYYPLQYLKQQRNIDSALIYPGYRPRRIAKFLRFYLEALLFRKKNSLIVIQRLHSNFIYANLLKFLIKIRKTNTVYDLDDADWLEHPSETIFYFVKHSSIVVTGSHELIKNLAQRNSNLALNTSPTPDLNIVKKQKNELFTIGWIGCFGGGHKKSLVNYFFPALKELKFPAKLIILGVTTQKEHEFLKTYFQHHPNIYLEIPLKLNWLDEYELQKTITTFDVGIATLLNDELHRSKSAFKLKQYFNNGVPVLSSNLPENNYFLRDGINGYLCSSPAEFKQRLQEIHELDDDAYLKMSEAARTSSTAFNLELYTRNLCDLAV